MSSNTECLVQPRDMSKPNGRAGLANIGNTCGLNALLQCIIRCKSFVHVLSKQLDESKGPLTTELVSIVDELWIQGRSIVPHCFVKAFHTSIHGRLIAGDQLDMSEMWMLLIDELEKEHVKIYESKRNEKESTHNFPWGTRVKDASYAHKALADRATEMWKSLTSRSEPTWNNILNGLQINQIVCHNEECRHVYQNFELFSTIALDIPIGTVVVELADCFKSYMKTESTEDWKCDKCSSSGQKIVRLWCAPKVLVVMLKRFRQRSDGHTCKVNTPINILQTFNFTNNTELCRNITTNHDGVFKLRAIGCHWGNLNGGHYTTISQDASGVWVHFDDLQHEVLIDETFLKNNQHAYLLFYERD